MIMYPNLAHIQLYIVW